MKISEMGSSMNRFYFKLPMMLLLFGLMMASQGCGGGAGTILTGSVSGRIIFGVQPVSLHSPSAYPVIPLSRPSKNRKSMATNSEKIIKFRSGLGESEITEIVTAMGGQLKSKIYGTENSYVVTMSFRNSSFQGKNYHSDIESIADNTILYANAIPNDTLYGQQWGYEMMYFPAAWDIQKGENRIPQITVAILDTGVRMTHQDLSPNLIIPTDICNFVNNNKNPSDDEGHGTHVAGIISAVSNNSTGVAGIAWNVKILPVKVLNFKGNGTLAQMIAGINYAVAKGAKVINLSLGGDTPASIPTDFIHAIDNATAHNATIIAAAGNEGLNQVNFPANYPGIIAVAALDPDGQLASYSNYGPQIMVCAPGGAGDPINTTQTIISTYYNADNSYAYMVGTSMAAPHVSGLVALFYSQIPGITPAEIKRRLQSFAIDKGVPGLDNYYGYGIPNAYAALFNQPTQLPEVQVHIVSTAKVIQFTQYPDGLGNYNIGGISSGVKHICAFLDKNRNGQVDSGDMFGYQTVTIQAGVSISNADITLTDVQIFYPAPSLANYLKMATVVP